MAKTWRFAVAQAIIGCQFQHGGHPSCDSLLLGLVMLRRLAG